MKKMILALMTLSAVVLMTSCGSMHSKKECHSGCNESMKATCTECKTKEAKAVCTECKDKKEKPACTDCKS